MALADMHQDQVDQLLQDLQAWASRSRNAREFLAAFRARGYSSQVIADALVRTWAGDVPELQQSEAYRQGLAALLQQTLTSEHVAAQERMNRSAGHMALASVALAAVSAVIALAELWRTGALDAVGAAMCDSLWW